MRAVTIREEDHSAVIDVEALIELLEDLDQHVTGYHEELNESLDALTLLVDGDSRDIIIKGAEHADVFRR